MGRMFIVAARASSLKMAASIAMEASIAIPGMVTISSIRERTPLTQVREDQSRGSVTQHRFQRDSAAEFYSNGGVSKKRAREKMLDNICHICATQDINAVLIPCGHILCCFSCARPLLKCPLCRRPVKAYRIFYA